MDYAKCRLLAVGTLRAKHIIRYSHNLYYVKCSI